jgi:superfamily II DNA or RNA helicase
MNLRPYQQRAVDSVSSGWSQWRRQLGVAATGAGKTILFSHIAAAEKGRTLILAHREELVMQAVEKLHKATGIFAAIEQGPSRAMPGHGVIVGSVQSMRRRLKKYAPDAFSLIVADEAHHSMSPEWQAVLHHFASARVLGVTATPDRADRKSLGGFYENVAFEISLLELINAGYLAPIRSLRLGVELDARHLRLKDGRKDITADAAAELISPRMMELARAVARETWDRKALIFLPRCDVSEAFAAALCLQGIESRHVAGVTDDREGQLEWFRKAGPGSALCNAMLLTEGYDQPDIDCIVCLRATKSRSLYAQIVGRGTRISPGKDYCLLLDPLWLSGEIDLCRPADLVAPNKLHRDKLQARMNEGLELTVAETIAKQDVEEALAEQLKEAARNRKAPKGLVDPLAYAVGLHDSDLSEYEPTMPWECEPPTMEQLKALTEWGVWTEKITRGFAVKLLERIEERERLGLATPKQVRLLRQYGEPNADTMTKGEAGYRIGLGTRSYGRRAA